MQTSRLSLCVRWFSLAVLFLGQPPPGLADDDYFSDTETQANVYVAPVPSAVEKIAILPFKAQTELIGGSVSDLFITEILRTRRYEMVERGQMAHVLSETELALAGLSEAKAMEAGRMIGADGVVIGTVDEYSTVADRGKVLAVVGVSARLIDCQTGKILWSADHALRSDDAEVTLAQQARIVTHEIVSALYQNWRVQRKVTTGKIPTPRTPSDTPPPQSTAPIKPSDPIRTAPPRPSVPVEAPPPAPAAPTVSDLGQREVVLTWTAPAGFTGKIQVERADRTNGPFRVLTRLSAQKGRYVDSGNLEDGKTYYYQLSACSPSGLISVPSPVRESMTAPPPDPPSGIRAETPGPRSVRLRWSSVSGADQYRVERSPGAGPEKFVQRLETKSPEFSEDWKTAPDLKDGTDYLYRVISISRFGAAGRPSDPMRVTTRPPPAAVTGVSATDGDIRSVTLRWQPHPEAEVTTYEIRRTTPEGTTRVIATLNGRTNTLYRDTGDTTRSGGLGALADGAVFRYEVAALNTVKARSPWSVTVAGRTRAIPPPPAGLSATTNLAGTIHLVWQPGPDKSLKYRVRSADSIVGPFRDTFDVSIPSFAEKQDLPGRIRYYRICALDAAGRIGPESEIVQGQSRPRPPDPQPLAADYGDGSVTLRWKPISAEAPCVYHVWLDRANRGKPIGETRETHWTLRHTEVDEPTTFFVTAMDNAGLESQPGTEFRAEEPAPIPPAQPTATSDGLREIRISWKKPADNARFIRIFRSESVNGPFEPVAQVNPADGVWTDQGAPTPLPDSAVRYYRLTAVARSGRSSSDSATIIGRTAPPPEPPTGLRIEAPAARALRVTWTASRSPDVIAYEMERTDANAPTTFRRVAHVTSGTMYSQGGTKSSDLQDSSTYFYRIRSINRVNATGTVSDAVSGVTRPPPASVQGFAARSGEVRCIPLFWDPAAEEDVTQYEIFRAASPSEEPTLRATLSGRATIRFLDGGKDPGILNDDCEYSYYAVAVNSVGARSVRVGPVSARTRPCPPAPVHVAARSGQPRAVTISWTASPDEKVIAYSIARSCDTNDWETIAEVEGRNEVVYSDRGGVRRASGPGGLKDGTAYRYRIQAINTARASSGWSDPATATTKPAPQAPTELRASTNRPNAIAVSWNRGAEHDLREYVVESRAADSTRWHEVSRMAAGDATPTVNETKLDSGETRAYRVKSVDEDTLESAWSEECAGVTKPRPSAPTDLIGAWAGEDIDLRWNAPPEPDVREYRIWKKGLMGHDLLLTTTATECRIVASQAGKNISVTVSAVDADGLESDRAPPVNLRRN